MACRADGFLCAIGDALSGGDTTHIKSSLLLIGEADQAKSAQLESMVAAGGWKEQDGNKRVDTSGLYVYGGAEPNALLGKDKARSAMYTHIDGLSPPRRTAHPDAGLGRRAH